MITQTPQPSSITMFSDLGLSVTLRTVINNEGPTTIREGTLMIFLPNRTSANEEFPLLYPQRLSVS